MTPRRITVGDIISEHSRSYPGQLALADGEYHLTWPELDERVNRLANALRTSGVGQGDRILWLGQNSFRVYELLGAAARIGAMVCPGYWRWAPPEMAFAIEDFRPKVVIWQEEEIGSTVRAARAASPAAESALWLRHDTGARHGYEAFLAAGDPADPGLDIDPDSALLVIYTAAITGRQCGSMLSHTNLISQGMSVAWMGDIDDQTVFLNSGPMFHIGNFQFFGIPVLVQGGTNVVARRVVAAELLDILAAERCTRAYLMPSTITQLTGLMAEHGLELPHLKATIAPQLWQGLVAADDSRHGREGGGRGYGYGQTEVSGFCVFGAYGGMGAGNAGRPGPVTAVRILDARGDECPAGEAGEICVRGDTGAPGVLEPPGDQRAPVPRWLVAHHGPGTPGSRRHAHLPRHDDPDDQVRGGEHLPGRGGELPGSPSGGAGSRGDRRAERALRSGREGGRRTERNRDRLPLPSSSSIAGATSPPTRSRRTVEFLDALPRTEGFAKDYAALDEKFGGGGYPGGENLGGGHPGGGH